MVFSYEKVENTVVPNTTTQLRLRDGVPYQYLITPNENYVLHETGYDYSDLYDEKIIHKGYTASTITCSVDYDFETNEREIYAVVESEVDE